MSRRIRWVALAALAVVLGTALALQRQANNLVREEIEFARDEHARIATLKSERARLQARQTPAAEVESLRSDHAAVERLRAEVGALRGQVEAKEKTAAAK